MTPIRVATFNVRYDTPEDGSRAWRFRRERVVRRLRNLDPTVVAVQEALPHQYRDLRTRLPGYDWVGTGRAGDGTGEHVLVGYDPDRCRLADSGGFWLSGTPARPSVGWDGACPRVATWARLAVDGWPCHVVATHLDHDGERARLFGAELLAQYVGAQSVPTLLAGDLNAPPGSGVLARLTASGVRPARAAATDAVGPPETFHRYGDATEQRIDYVLVPETVSVDRAGTVAAGPPHASDHRPAFADLRPATDS